MKVLDLMLELGVATDTKSSNRFHILCEKFPTQSTRFDTNWSCKILAIKYVKDGEEYTVKYDDLPCEHVYVTDNARRKLAPFKNRPFWINGSGVIHEWKEGQYLDYSYLRADPKIVIAIREKYELTEPTVFKGKRADLTADEI
jgi:hypothetical protein